MSLFTKLWDQINPADNGRTWSNPNPTPVSGASGQPNQNNQGSVIHQLTHNAVTNVAGGIIKPTIQFPMDWAQTWGNIGTNLAGGQQQSAQQFWHDPLTSATRQMADSTGTNRQLLGSGIQVGLDALLPGFENIAEKGLTYGAGLVLPNLAERAAAGTFMGLGERAVPAVLGNIIRYGLGPTTGALVGGPFNVANTVSSNEPLTPKSVGTSYLKGTEFGAITGTAEPLIKGAVTGVNAAVDRLRPGEEPVTPTQIPVTQKPGPRTSNIPVENVNARLGEIRKQLDAMPSEDNINVVKFNARKQFAENLNKNPMLRDKLWEHYNTTMDAANQALETRKQLANEADTLKMHPTYQGNRTGQVVVTGRATIPQDVRPDTSLAQPAAPVEAPVKVAPPEPTPQVNVTPVAETKHGVVQVLKQTQQDKYAVLGDQMKAIDKQLGKPEEGLSRSDQFYYNRKMVEGANATANRVLETSPHVQEAFGGMSKNDYKAFSDYANARTELASAGEKTATSRPLGDLKATVDNATPEQQARFTALNNHYKDLAGVLRDSGIIDKATYDRYTQNGDYIRLQRDMGDLLPDQFGGGNGLQLGSTVAKQRRLGSSRATVDAGTVVADYTQKVYKEAAKNQAGTQIVDVLKQAGLADPLDNAAAARHQNVVKVIRDGKVEYYRVPPVIKEAVNNLNPQTMNIVTRIAAAPGRLFRAGVTGLNPVFIVRNLFKDQSTSAINSENLLATHNPKAFADGLIQATRETVGGGHSALYEDFLKHYGDQTSYDINRNTEQAAQVMNRIRGGKVVGVGQAVTHPIRSLESIASITEKSTRYQQFAGTYRKAIADGLDHQDAMQQAAVAAWRNTVDFGTAGTWGKVINTVIPYWNPGVQGLAQMAKTFKDHPVSSTFKGIAFIGAPLATATAWNLSRPDSAQIYNNIPEYEKDNNLILIPPGTKQNQDGTYDVWKIPLPPGYKDVFMPFRRAMESYAEKKPVDGKMMANDILQAITGPVNVQNRNQVGSSFIPQAAKPWIQQGMNKDLYTGKDIVPGYINDATDENGNPIPESQKAYKNTSATAEFIGKKIGVSPIRVEKFIKDSAGTVGLNVENAVDNAAAHFGKASPDNIGGQSVAGGFKRSFGQAQGIVNENRSDGAKHFEQVKEVTKGFNQNEQAAFDSLHPATKNFLGDQIYQREAVYDPAARLDIYNRYPKVFEADKQLDAKGDTHNPLFSLEGWQAKKVLEKDNLPPGSTDPELSGLYKQEWYQNYQTQKSAFFTKLADKAKAEGKPFGTQDNPYPTTSAPLQKIMDSYTALPKGTGARSTWIKSNPGAWKEMQDQFAAIDNWQNVQRGKRGLDATEGAVGQAAGYNTGSTAYNSSRRSSGNVRVLKSESYLKKYSVPTGKSGGSGKVNVTSVAIKPRKSSTGKVTVKSSKIRLA